MVYGEFDRYTIEIQTKKRKIKHWSKILTDKDSKSLHKIYSVLLYLHKNNIYSCNWIVCIEKKTTK